MADYDYIIVGAGSAGGALAARLSENAKNKILLLEAGAASHPYSRMPLSFGLLIDKWRWDVFQGKTPPERYNESWWELRLRYQGVAPPSVRPANAFDPGAKYHIPGNTPYARYFLAFIYEFQFYRAACREAGWQGPLNRCSVFGNKEVGKKFNALLEQGQSRPWREILADFTGEKDIDAGAIRDYFAPLNEWLSEQNRGKSCGW